jgi:hypothetical protein
LWRGFFFEVDGVAFGCVAPAAAALVGAGFCVAAAPATTGFFFSGLCPFAQPAVPIDSTTTPAASGASQREKRRRRKGAEGFTRPMR